MIPTLKTPEEIARMRRAGLVVWRAHQAAAPLVRPGTPTSEIEEAVRRVLREEGADPVFTEASGPVPYPAATCVSINEEVVHGIPGPRRIRAGDLVGVDVGARLDGWCADAAVTRAAGAADEASRRLLAAGEEALREALAAVAVEPLWSGVARRIEAVVLDAGFTVVEDLVGHGVGRRIWEPPEAPNRHRPGMPDFRLRTGLVLAVEPMLSAGAGETRTLADGWTIVTADGSRSVHFEHTVALTPDGPQVLTSGPAGEGWALKESSRSASGGAPAGRQGRS